MKSICFFGILLLNGNNVFAQLDTKHYIPPCYAGTDSYYNVGKHWAVITTPSTEPIEILIQRGNGIEIDRVTVSRTKPIVYLLGAAVYNSSRDRVIRYPHGVIDYSQLNTKLADQGLIFSSDKPFYVNIRHRTSVHGFSLTSKGQSALGTLFRSGHIYSKTGPYDENRSHFISVMATEDNTSVTFSEIKTGVITSKSKERKAVGGNITKVLNAGESYVIATNFEHLTSTTVNELNGTKITSDKPIAVNSGSWTASADVSYNAQDIGMDQIVPEASVGTEYILIRGKGNSQTERPIIVATEDGTEIFVNGVKQSRTLNAGEYYPIETSKFSSNGTMFVKTSKRVYAYQTISGSNVSTKYKYATVGMNFIPPLSTSGIREVDIPQVDQLGNGVITILAQYGANVYLNNSLVPLGGGKTVAGKPDWVCYSVSGQTGDVNIVSDKAITVALVTQSTAVGAAGYYSGFTKTISPIVPNVGVKPDGDVSVVCEDFDGAVVLRNVGDEASVYRWYDKATGELISENSYLSTTPEKTNTYLLKAYYRDVNQETLLNGDFEQNHLFFYTGDSYSIEYSLDNGGKYYVDNKTQIHNNSFSDIVDHTSKYGNMMIVYGTTTKDVVWKWEVPVDPNENYIFSLWGRQIMSGSDELLQFYINGEPQGKPFHLNDMDQWQNELTMWNSGAAPTAVLEIVNLNTTHSGVFALDDISFVRAVKGEAEYTISVVPKVKYSPLEESTHYCAGQSFSLDVSNGDEDLFTYQWMRKGKEILEGNVTGINGPVLSFTNATETNQGDYTCHIVGVSECGHDEVTLPTKLIMDTPVHIVTPEVNQTVCEGKAIPFDLDISGGYKQIQWQRNGVDQVGFVGKSYTYTTQHDDGDVTISCLVSGGCDPVSWEAHLHVQNLPEIEIPLHAETTCSGLEATLSLKLKGDGKYHYTWYKGTEELGQTDIPEFKFTAAMEDNGAPFRVVVSGDGVCDPISFPIDKPFHVKQVGKVKVEPEDDVLCRGESFVTEIQMNGNKNDFSYQWSLNGIPLEKQTNARLVVNDVDTDDTGTYTVVVDNGCGPLEFEANLMVLLKPDVTSAIVAAPVGPYCLGQGVDLSATSNKTQAQYVWRNGVAEKVSLSPALNLDPLSEVDFGRWVLEMKNQCGSDQESIVLEKHPDLTATPPSDQEVCAGDRVSFQVLSNGTGFQWYHGDAIIGGATTSELQLSNVTLADAGTYRCEVNGPCGSLTVEANLMVADVLKGIENTHGCVGDPFDFTIETVGTFSYQWYRIDKSGEHKLDGETAATCHIDKLTKDHEGIYKCVTQSVCGEQPFQAQLDVYEITSVTKKLEPVEKCVGDELIMEIKATGVNMQYVWMRNGKPLEEFRDKPVLHIPVLDEDDTGTYTYKVRVIGECKVDSTEAQVTVHPASKIGINGFPDQVVCENNPLVLEVDAEGYELSFDWIRNGIPIATDAGSRLDLGNSTEAMEGVYTVNIKSSQCSEISTSATIDIKKRLTVGTPLDDIELCENEKLDLKLDVEGGDLEFAWEKNDAPLGDLLKEYTVENVSLDDAGKYTCQVTTKYNCGDQLFESNVTVHPNAEVKLDPEPVDICELEEAVFTAEGGDVFGAKTYQWYADGVKVGGNSNEYRFWPDFDNDNGKNYYCEIFGEACEHAFSKPASLTITRNVWFSKHPQPLLRLAQNSDAEFIVDAIGAPALTYQWECKGPLEVAWTPLSDDATYSGSKTAKLIVKDIDLSLNEMEYRCVVVSEKCGQATSDPAKLIVDELTKIQRQPQPMDICEGLDAHFSVAAAGTSPSYQWKIKRTAVDSWEDLTNDGTFEGVDMEELTVKAVTPSMSGYQFMCVVTGEGAAGSEDSGSATLTVKENVTLEAITNIDGAPVGNLSICSNEEVTFIAKAKGSGDLTYEWYHEGNPVAVGATLVLNEGNALEGTYKCTVSGACEPDSKEAKIAYYTPTKITTPLDPVEICLGTGVKLSVVADYETSAPVHYTWTKDGAPLVADPDPSSYSIDGDDLADAGVYQVTVIGKCGSDDSQAAVGILVPLTKNNNWDAEYPVCEGENLDLQVSVAGSNPTYTWYHGTEKLKETGPLLSLKDIGPDQVGDYRCEVANGVCDPVEYLTKIRLKDPTSVAVLDEVLTFCENGPVVLTVNAKGENLHYSWSFEGTEVGTESTHSIPALDEAGAGIYTCTVTGACGSVTAKREVQMIPLFDMTKGLQDFTVCEGVSAKFQVFATGEGLDYEWSNDKGEDLSAFDGKSVLNIAKAEFGEPVEYSCKVNGLCSDGPVVSKATLYVNQTTRLLEALPPKDVCEGEEVEFVIKLEGKVDKYIWTLDGKDLDNDAASLDLGSIKADQAGVYACAVKGVCGNRYASTTLRVKPVPFIEEGLGDPQNLCVGQQLNLRLTAKGENLTYEWYRNEKLLKETTSELQVNSVTQSNSGLYKCLVDGTCISDPFVETVQVTVNPLIRLNKGIEDLEICDGEPLQLQMDVDGSDLNYFWEKDGAAIGENSSLLEFTPINLTDEGNYICRVTSVCGKVDSRAFVDVKKKTKIQIQPKGTTVCENTKLVSFYIQVDGDDVQLQWRKDGEIIEGEIHPVLSISGVGLEDAGRYDCVVTSFCADDQLSDVAELNVIPLSRIDDQSKDLAVCLGEPVNFKVEASGVNLGYQWRKGGVNIPGATAAEYSIPIASIEDIGFYDCVISADCSEPLYSTPMALNVEALPVAPIYGRMELCAGEERVVYMTSDISDYEFDWEITGGNSLGNENPRRFNVTWEDIEKGSLHLTILAPGSGCRNQVDSLVTLFPLPDVSLREFAPRGICNPEFALQGGLPEGGIYWIEDQPRRDFDPAEGPGTYAVKYTYTDANGCSGTSPVTAIKVAPQPQVKAMADRTIGSCQTVRLRAESDQSNMEWSSPTDQLDASNLEPGTTQRFQVKVLDEYGCQGQDYVNITMAPAPKVKTIADTTIGQCKHIELTTQAEGEKLTTLWTPGNGLSRDNLVSPILETPIVGDVTYKVRVVDAYGCEAEDEVKVHTDEQQSLGSDQFACEGEIIPVDISGLSDIFWTDGYSETVRKLEAPGEYRLRVEDQYGCGDEQRFVIYPTPQINMRDTFIYEGQRIHLDPKLDGNYGPYGYLWQDGSILGSYEASQEGTYSVSVLDQNGCEAEKSIFLEVKEKSIAAPNAFIPKGIEDNSRFYLKEVNFADDFGLYIYNRWGTLVFESHEIGYAGGWDGTYNGEKCPGGSYVWVAMVNGEMVGKGSVVLIR
ncbi:MAG: gliding motility-associated C-terminal domain-containing protein [Marinifilaceae bacterium]